MAAKSKTLSMRTQQIYATVRERCFLRYLNSERVYEVAEKRESGDMKLNVWLLDNGLMKLARKGVECEYHISSFEYGLANGTIAVLSEAPGTKLEQEKKKVAARKEQVKEIKKQRKQAAQAAQSPTLF